MRLPKGRALQRLLAGVAGAAVGGWIGLSLREMRFAIEGTPRPPGVDVVGILLALAGAVSCALAAMSLVPGRNPWRF